MISIVCCGLLLGLVSPSRAEVFFHWTDETGASRYSNVAPPASAAEYSVAAVFSTKEEKPVRKVDLTGTDSSGEIVTSSRDVIRTFLQERIKHRSESIRHIEALLRKNPDDMILRKNLLRKRRYLHEELSRLNTLY
jgi:hypothetical protein